MCMKTNLHNLVHKHARNAPNTSYRNPFNACFYAYPTQLRISFLSRIWDETRHSMHQTFPQHRRRTSCVACLIIKIKIIE